MTDFYLKLFLISMVYLSSAAGYGRFDDGSRERGRRHKFLRDTTSHQTERLYDQLRPVSFRVERNSSTVTYTISYAAHLQPEVLWFDDEGTLVPTSGRFQSGRGYAQVTTDDFRFGYILLQPSAGKFYVYTAIPLSSGPGPVWEYTYLQMDVEVHPGFDISYANGTIPTLTITGNRETSDIKVSGFVESYLYHPSDRWIYESPSFLDFENDDGPIEHLGDVSSDHFQRFTYRIKGDNSNSTPQGISIFNIMPSDAPSADHLIRYQLMLSISVYPEGSSSVPFPTDKVQFIDTRCDTKKSCDLGQTCRLTCLAVGNHIQNVEVIRVDNPRSMQIIVPHDTVYFEHVVDASLTISDFNTSSVYMFKVTGNQGYMDIIDVTISVVGDN